MQQIHSGSRNSADQQTPITIAGNLSTQHVADIVEWLDVQDPAFAASVIDNMPFDRAVAVLEQPGFDHPQARINTGWTRRAPEGGTGTIRSNLPREGFTNAATAQMLPRRIANPTKKARTETSRNSRTETQGLHEQEPGLAIWARKRSASAR